MRIDNDVLQASNERELAGYVEWHPDCGLVCGLRWRGDLGVGATAYGARFDFGTTMRSERIAVLADDEDPAGAGRIVDTCGCHVTG